MRAVRIGALATMALLAPLLFSGPANAAASPDVTAVAVLYSTRDPAYEVGKPRFGDNQRVTVQAAWGGGFAVTVDGSPYWSIEFHPPTGKAFGLGRYPNVSGSETSEHAAATLYIGSNSVPFDGEFEIRDWAVGSNGRPSRFDILFRTPGDVAAGGYFGQLRLGRDAGLPVAIAARSLTWPDTPVGSVPITATEWVHNTSPAPVAIGAAALAGNAKSDYLVRQDGCSGRTLAAGATCSLTVGFSPRAAGPRIAALRLPVNGATRSIGLAGTAPSGTTKVTSSGDDYVDQGTADSFAEGPSMVLAARPGGPGYIFTNAVPYTSSGYDEVMVIVAGPDGLAPPLGTQPTGDISGTGSILRVTHSGRGFTSSSGTMTVRRFQLDSQNRPVAADIDFTIHDGIDPAHPMTGTLRFRARSDYTPPKPPTAVSVTVAGSTRTVRWTDSVSTDRKLSIARLVPGDGALATPTSGIALAAGTSTTATLPALRAGQRYTVAVFAVDKAGNVSRAATRAVIG